MKFVADRPWSDPEKAARKLLEIANAAEAVQDTAGSISRRSTGRSCSARKPRRPNTGPASIWRFAWGWPWMHDSGTYVVHPVRC